MTFGDLPPSSSATRFTVSAATAATRLPARVEPVNEIMSTSGCETSASPTSAPVPVTRLKTPGGKPDGLDDLGEDERGQRRDLARLEDDRAAGGERRRDFRCDLVQRIIPRRDAADDADRFVHDRRVADLLVLRFARRDLRDRRERHARQTRLDHDGLRDRHAEFARHEHGDLHAARFDAVADRRDVRGAPLDR